MKKFIKKIASFFTPKQVENLIEMPSNKLLAKKFFSKGSAAAFLEIREGKEFWVYGKFYDPRGNRGPEVKIDFPVSQDIRQELLKRRSWGEPMSSAIQTAINEAWLEAAEKCDWFEPLADEVRA
jgi:hypothetical protein